MLMSIRVNKEGKYVYIKYHFLAKHGQKQFTGPEAVEMSGENPDYAKQQLWEAIERGEEITWKANVQIMQPEEADANKLGFDPFDVTKVWPRGQFPMHEFGKLVLNKNPENYHRDVEQAAFSPGSMVPGIEDSPDPLLQFRMFFYRDAQYHRVGVNLHQVPVNCPFMAGQYASLNFDGPMRTDANHAGNKQYVPNSFKHTFRPDVAEAPYSVSDNVVSRKSHYAHESKKSEYDQARELYKRVMSDTAREHTHQNTAKMMSRVNYPIIQVSRSIRCYLRKAEHDCRRSILRRSTTLTRNTQGRCSISYLRRSSPFLRLKSLRRMLIHFIRSPSSGLVRASAWLDSQLLSMDSGTFSTNPRH